MRTANDYYKDKFGCKVYKLSLDGGFTCPNRDGTLGFGGCAFCTPEGSGEFAEKPGQGIARQLEGAKARVADKCRSGKYIAYFQSFTGTYGPVDKLEDLYRAALEPEEILGLAIGTRPDCLPEETVALLKELNRFKPVSVELGLQTANDAVARDMNRCYDTWQYVDAVRRLKDAGLEVVTHIILGLPTETEKDMLFTTKTALEAGTDGVKFHLLHVLRGSRLEERYARGEFACLTLEEYGAILKKCVALLPPEIVVHRITGDGARRELVAPLWSLDKKRVLNYLNGLLGTGQNRQKGV